MPATVKVPPDSNVSLEASSSRCYFETCRTHIYFALGAVVFFIAIRLITAQLRDSKLAYPWSRTHQKRESEKILEPSPSFDSKRGPLTPWSSAPKLSARSCPYFSPDQHGTKVGFSNPPQKFGPTAGLPSPAAETGLIGPSWHPLAMDGDVSKHRKDHSGSAPATTSRGVSTNTSSAADIRCQFNPSLGGIRSGSSAERRRNSRSSRSSTTQGSSPNRQHDSTDGADSPGSQQGKGEGKGKGLMTSQGSRSRGAQSNAPEENIDPSRSGQDLAWRGSTQSVGFSAQVDYSTSSWQFSRPPPPPPLTPPTLGDSMFPFENRRPSCAVSIPPELDGSFVHQANAGYESSSTSADVLSSSPRSVTGTARRRSYTKSVPVGIPMPIASSSDTAASPADFSPSSFPPRAPLLPPPPPGGDFPYEYQFVGGPGGPGVFDSEEEVDLHGEVISVVDHAGHGWTRHTRVYGGGVCLACIAAGGEGGFYGDKVPLEDRR